MELNSKFQGGILMKISIDEIKKEPLKKERLVYNGETGNRIDVEVYLSPLRAMYKVGKEASCIIQI